MIIEVARYIIWYIMRLLNATLLVNCKKIWYGKQKHLGCNYELNLMATANKSHKNDWLASHLATF